MTRPDAESFTNERPFSGSFPRRKAPWLGSRSNGSKTVPLDRSEQKENKANQEMYLAPSFQMVGSRRCFTVIPEKAVEQKGFIAMSSVLPVVTLFFFVVIAMGACALVGSLLFDLLPVLRDGDDRVRQPLVFPEVATRPAVRTPATVHRLPLVDRATIRVAPLPVAA
ncbi:hypothetical protein [Croceicoccus naphthovorans]|uniref:hypothetical protein n=1 Tax=Croceicoccus naphthovorans TaxID=1348774 RepID=UPI0012E09D26|nr:hypothetical protein [Croceicoccus naphthovorans]